MDNTQNSIVYAVNSDLDDEILYAEFETKDAAIEYAKRNLDKLPFVDELQVSRDANGEVDDVFEYKTIWDHTMADDANEEAENDYWDELEAMYDAEEDGKHVIGDTTWFEEGWLDKDGVWDETDDALIADYETAMAAKDTNTVKNPLNLLRGAQSKKLVDDPANEAELDEAISDLDALRMYDAHNQRKLDRRAARDQKNQDIMDKYTKYINSRFESVDPSDLVETLEENENTVECKECFDLFPKADCIKVEFGYICPTCAEGGTVSEEDLFKMDFPEYEKMNVGNDMLPDEPMIPAEPSEEVPPVEIEAEIDPISTPEEAIPFLVNDEEEAIAGYEKAAEVVEDSDLENKDEILEVIDHIKEEEEEHIEELTKLTEPTDEEDSDEEASEDDAEVEDDEVVEDEAEELIEDIDTDIADDTDIVDDTDIADAKKALQLAKINTKIEKQRTKAARQVAKQAKAGLTATKNTNKATKDTSSTNVAVSSDSVKVAKKDLKKAKIDAKRLDLQSKTMDPDDAEQTNEELRITEAFGVTPMTKDELYDRLVNEGETVDLDIGDQGYGPEDTGSFSDGGYYSNSIINIEFDDGKFGATEFYMSESGDEKEGYWDFETESFDELWSALVNTFELEDLVEHVNEEHPAVESDQELAGTDNAVVDCKVAEVVSHSEDEDCVDCENKKKDPLNEDLVLLGTLASALALSMANAAVGGFFWDNLKKLAATIFKRKPKSKWFAYKNYIIEQTEEGQVNIWNLDGEQVGTDLKTIKLAKQVVKNLSQTEDQEIPADESREVASAATEEGISDPIVEIDPDSLEAIEEVPVDEIFVAPEDDGIELTDIR